ncbi:hypothetical protein FQN54_001521 [Arachnomyces sp. PD_36]|nr:hypothetical protein FQN54_001521 [Arachnomyces sp. PD_36]
MATTSTHTNTHTHPSPWPNTRNQLLPNIVDSLAETRPDSIYAEVPTSPGSFSEGFRKITYADLANAVNGVALWIRENVGEAKAKGEGEKAFETLMYFGPGDGRHAILALGAVKAGYKMLFTTPRYSTSGQIELLKKVGCRTMLLASTPRPAVADEILEEYPMSSFQVPELEELLTKRYPVYPYSKTFEEAKYEPLVVLHTSGTTGTPKPVVWTHDWADSFCAERYLEPPEGFKCVDGYLKGKRVFSLLPHFHAGNNFLSLFFSLHTGTVIIYPLPNLPPAAHMLADALTHTPIDSSMMVPPFVEQLAASSPQTLSHISSNLTSKTIIYAGGSISDSAGKTISEKLTLLAVCGSTEMGFWPIIRRINSNSASANKNHDNSWAYMHFHPSAQINLEKRSDDRYETILHRASGDYIQPIFTLPPHRESERYETSDLWTPHPTEEGLWKHVGRTDDMLTFASGEKFHPSAFEEYILGNVGSGLGSDGNVNVKGVLVVGTGRKRAVLLVEAERGVEGRMDMDREREGLMSRIWPVVEKANEMCPVYARVGKGDLLIVDGGRKALPRTAKGSVRRDLAVRSFKEEVNQLFKEESGR